MILLESFCRRLWWPLSSGAVIFGMLLLAGAPQRTGAHSVQQPAATPPEQKTRDLEQRLQKLEEKMDRVLATLHDGHHGSFTPLTTVQASQTLEDAIHALRLDTNTGNLELVRSETAEMTVKADVRVDKTRADAKNLGDKFEQHVRISRSGDTLTIADAHKDAPDHAAWAVSLKVAVPRALPVEAKTGAGNVDVEFASGSVSLSGGAGNLTLKSDRLASVAAHTGAGNATLRVRKVSGKLKADSGAGNVTLNLGEVGGKVEAKSGAGNVSLHLTAGGARDDVTLSSGSGSLVLELPTGATGTFDIHSGVGSISVDGLKGVKVKKNRVGASAAGQLGEGGPHYQLHAGVGSIRATVRK